MQMEKMLIICANSLIKKKNPNFILLIKINISKSLWIITWSYKNQRKQKRKRKNKKKKKKIKLNNHKLKKLWKKNNKLRKKRIRKEDEYSNIIEAINIIIKPFMLWILFKSYFFLQWLWCINYNFKKFWYFFSWIKKIILNIKSS